VSNQFYNFRIPDFQDKYGDDWDGFQAVIDDNWDYVFKKAWELYHLVDLNRMPVRVVEYQMNLRSIDFSYSDTAVTKKVNLRNFVNKYVNKGLASVYLDIAEGVTGSVGDLYLDWDRSGFDWDVDHWDFTWQDEGSKFIILFDVKTTDSGELDEIQALLQDESVKPAYYKIVLVDSDFNILRSI
jgi:hypothetical protein